MVIQETLPKDKKCSGYGPGGRNCNCCGPSPKNRKKHDRAVKRSVKAKIMKEVENDIDG